MKNTDFIAQEGAISVWHRYTVGIALEDFFRELKKGVFTGRKCPECSEVYLPPRTYCETCLVKLSDPIEIQPKARLVSYTKLWISLEGKRLDEPKVIGFFRFEGTKGGIFAPVKGILKIGGIYRPVLKKRRKGSIKDIKNFERVNS
jgi:hypothetical protein